MKISIPQNKRLDFRLALRQAWGVGVKAVKHVAWDQLSEIITNEEASEAVKKHKARVEWRKQHRLDVSCSRSGRILDLLEEKWYERKGNDYGEWCGNSPEVSVKSLPELPEWVISILRSNGYRRICDFNHRHVKGKQSLLWSFKGIDEYWVPRVIESFAAAKERYRHETGNQKTSQRV